MDERFREFIAFGAGMETPNTKALWDVTARGIRRNRKRVEEILASRRYLPELDRYAIPVDASIFSPMIEWITRGLYWHFYKERLPLDVQIEAKLMRADTWLAEFTTDMVRVRVGGDQFFVAYQRMAQYPTISVWIYVFHNHVVGMALTDMPLVDEVGAKEKARRAASRTTADEAPSASTSQDKQMALPENFGSLHDHEEALRRTSIAAIEASEELSAHALAMESAMNALHHFTHGYPTEDQDKLMVQLLGIRMFNSAGAGMKLLLSGYYQNAATLMRELLETANLVDYFTIDPTLITRWRTADDRGRWKEFKPVLVREALGKRDGEDSRKRRDEIYKVFSNFASHPTPQGFRFLRRSTDGLHLIGPFFEPTSLAPLFVETAKTLVPAAMHLVRHFECRTRLDHLAALGFIEKSDRWSARFFGTPYEPDKFVALRRQVDAAFSGE